MEIERVARLRPGPAAATLRYMTVGGRAELQLTCIVVESHPEVLDALALVLPGEGIDVVATARSGAEAIDLIRRRDAGVVLVDLALSDTNGIELARELRRTKPGLRVVLYAADLASGPAAALDAGVRGIVLKESPIEELVRALRMVAAGASFVDPRIGRERG